MTAFRIKGVVTTSTSSFPLHHQLNFSELRLPLPGRDFWSTMAGTLQLGSPIVAAGRIQVVQYCGLTQSLIKVPLPVLKEDLQIDVWYQDASRAKASAWKPAFRVDWKLPDLTALTTGGFVASSVAFQFADITSQDYEDSILDQ